MPIFSKTRMPTITDRNPVTKRNVIATDIGWVRRITKPNLGRVLDEVLVPMTGLQDGMGAPDAHQIYFEVNGANVTIGVVYDEPVRFGANSGNVAIAVANTSGGAAFTAVCAANNNNIINANNTLLFRATGVTAGTYRIANTANIVNATATAANVRTWNVGGEAANLSIANTVKVAAGTFTV